MTKTYALDIRMVKEGGVPENWRIEGHVRDDETNAPIVGADVLLYVGGGGQPIQTAASDSTGFYALTSVEDGEYLVVCMADGYQTTPTNVALPPT